ncbi:MAG TPA: phosphate regulon sensor protein PhoR, partial [Steroidobacteraceae bacterium]
MNSGTTAFVYVAVRLLVALALGAAAGWFAGSVWAGISATFALYLAWNLWQLRELWYWLQHRSVADPPDAVGLWGDVVAQVVRLHRRKRFHKERLTRLFRELRRSTAAMPDGVVMLDPQGEIVWFNRKAGELLDLSRRADLGLRIDNLVRHPDFVRYLHGGNYSLPAIVHLEAPTERYVAFQLISYGEDQRLLMLRDVTREVRMEQMRKDFVANASHELRSPLTVVAGYLETFG